MIEIIRQWKKTSNSIKEVGVTIKDVKGGKEYIASGKALCHPQDEFNYQTGLELATLRAKLKLTEMIQADKLDMKSNTLKSHDKLNDELRGLKIDVDDLNKILDQAFHNSICGPKKQKNYISFAMTSGMVHVVEMTCNADEFLSDLLRDKGLTPNSFIKLGDGPTVKFSAIEAVVDGDMSTRKIKNK